MKLFISTVVIALWLVSCSAKGDGKSTNNTNSVSCDSIYAPRNLSLINEHDSDLFSDFNIGYNNEIGVFIDSTNILQLKVGGGVGNQYAVYYDDRDSEIIITCYRPGWKEGATTLNLLAIHDICIDISSILNTIKSDYIMVSAYNSNSKHAFKIKQN